MKNNKSRKKSQDNDEKIEIKYHSEDYFPFFEKCLGKLKKDIFSDALLCRGSNGIWDPARNRIEFLSSKAVDEQQIVVRHISSHLSRLEYEVEPELIPEIPQWDGVDRLEIFAKALTDKNFIADEVKELITDFGVKMLQRIFDPQIQNRVLALVGAQGLGKDTFLNAMFDYLGQWQSNIVVTRNERDLCDSVSRLALAKITEIDRASKQEMAALKALTTEDSVFYRRPYERMAAHRPLRASFIATCNFEDFLSDPSGNRRFIVLNISSLSWEYPRDESHQVLAQLKYISELGETVVSPETERKLKNLIEEMTPEDPSDLAIEEMEKRIENICRDRGVSYLKKNEIMDLVVSVGVTFDISNKKILSLLKSRRYSKKYEEGIRYFPRPVNS
jgi:hypothetical protein